MYLLEWNEGFSKIFFEAYLHIQYLTCALCSIVHPTSLTLILYVSLYERTGNNFATLLHIPLCSSKFYRLLLPGSSIKNPIGGKGGLSTCWNRAASSPTWTRGSSWSPGASTGVYIIDLYRKKYLLIAKYEKKYMVVNGCWRADEKVAHTIITFLQDVLLKMIIIMSMQVIPITKEA